MNFYSHFLRLFNLALPWCALLFYSSRVALCRIWTSEDREYKAVLCSDKPVKCSLGLTFALSFFRANISYFQIYGAETIIAKSAKVCVESLKKYCWEEFSLIRIWMESCWIEKIIEVKCEWWTDPVKVVKDTIKTCEYETAVGYSVLFNPRSR